MSFLDTLQKWGRFRSEEKILSRISKNTTYTEETINKNVVKQDILIDGESVKESLSAKEEYIKAASQKETKQREKGKNLPAEEVKKLRDKEEKARYTAYRHIRNLKGR